MDGNGKRRQKGKSELWDALPEHPRLTNLKADYASIPKQAIPVIIINK